MNMRYNIGLKIKRKVLQTIARIIKMTTTQMLIKELQNVKGVIEYPRMPRPDSINRWYLYTSLDWKKNKFTIWLCWGINTAFHHTRLYPSGKDRHLGALIALLKIKAPNTLKQKNSYIKTYTDYIKEMRKTYGLGD